MQALRANDKRANMAQSMLWVMIVLGGLSIVSSLQQYFLLLGFQNGEYFSDDAIAWNDRREQLVAIFYLLGFILSAIFFIRWFRRAYFNLHQLNPKLSETEGWAAGAWFVPIYNLYKPFHIMKELCHYTTDLFKKHDLQDSKPVSNELIGLWWTFWITGNILSGIESKIIKNVDTIEGFMRLSLFAIVVNILFIVAAVFAIKIVKQYSTDEPLLSKVHKEKTSQDLT